MSNESAAAGHGSFLVSQDQIGKRLDVVLALEFPAFSRTQLRRAIVDGTALVDGKRAKPNYRLVLDQRVELVDAPASPPAPEPEPMPLDIVHEDDQMVVINKPAGIVVHPSKGHWSGTLVAGLAYHFESLSTVGGASRPGIVHRLDRDTSGILVVAKNDTSHQALASQFEARTVEKEYLAIVRGVPDRDADVIDKPIGVHPYQRDKMAIRAGHPTTRDAVTRYQVVERFRGFAVINVFPKTGRTHQIRVHLTHAGCPVLCDRLYAGHARVTRGELNGNSKDDQYVLQRQALHARRISLDHPTTKQRLTFEASLADDIASTLELLREFR